MDLRDDPGHKPHPGLSQRAVGPEDRLEGRERYVRLLPCTVMARALGHQGDPSTGQRLTQLHALVRQVAKQPSRQAFPELRTVEQFANQSDFCDVGRGEPLGDGHTVCGAQEVQLYPVDAKPSPPYPRRSLKALRLRNLARV